MLSGVSERRVEVVVKGRKRRCRKAGSWVAMMRARMVVRKIRKGESCRVGGCGYIIYFFV